MRNFKTQWSKNCRPWIVKKIKTRPSQRRMKSKAREALCKNFSKKQLKRFNKTLQAPKTRVVIKLCELEALLTLWWPSTILEYLAESKTFFSIRTYKGPSDRKMKFIKTISPRQASRLRATIITRRMIGSMTGSCLSLTSRRLLSNEVRIKRTSPC